MTKPNNMILNLKILTVLNFMKRSMILTKTIKENLKSSVEFLQNQTIWNNVKVNNNLGKPNQQMNKLNKKVKNTILT